MRKINVAEDIVPVGDFGSHAVELLEQLHQTRRPIVITREGKPAAVMITPEDFDEIAYAEMVREKIREGIESAAREPTVSPEEAKMFLFAEIARVAGNST